MAEQLRRNVTLTHGVGLAVSTIIGSGLLGLPGLAIGQTDPHTALAGWGLTLLISIPLMLIFMRLTQLVRDAGGLAHYAGLAFGPALGSAASLLIAATFALCIPAGTTMGAAYLQEIFYLPAWSVLPITLGLLAVSTAVNIGGAKPSRVVNTVAVVALVALIVLFVALNPAAIARGGSAVAEIATGSSAISLPGLWAATALLFWAFLGWENLSFGSEEYEDKSGFVAKVFLVGFAVVGLLYAALALVSTGAALSGKSISGVTGLLRLADDQPLRPVIIVLIALVVVANVNAWVFAASRLYFASGRSGHLPQYLGRLDSRGIPVASLATLFLIYAILAIAISNNLPPLVTALTIANQNFILLYVGAIATFVAVDKTAVGQLITLAGSISCLFLLSGFGSWLAIPLVIGAIGYLKYRLTAAPRLGAVS